MPGTKHPGVSMKDKQQPDFDRMDGDMKESPSWALQRVLGGPLFRESGGMCPQGREASLGLELAVDLVLRLDAQLHSPTAARNCLPGH